MSMPEHWRPQVVRFWNYINNKKRRTSSRKWRLKKFLASGLSVNPLVEGQRRTKTQQIFIKSVTMAATDG